MSLTSRDLSKNSAENDFVVESCLLSHNVHYKRLESLIWHISKFTQFCPLKGCDPLASEDTIPHYPYQTQHYFKCI